MFKNILIFGGTGFIGTNLLKKLNLFKYSLYSVSTKIPLKRKKIKKVKYIELDITKKKEFKKLNKFKIDIVVNLAGYIDHSNTKQTLKSHFEGAKNIIKYFNKKKLKLFIQAGSSLEYGDSYSPQREDFKCKPKSNYGLAKYKVTEYLSKLKNLNFCFIVLRLYQVYGPYQDTSRLIPYVIASCINNKFFNCTSGRQIRDFLFIDDLIELFIKIIKFKKFSNAIYNVGSGKKTLVKNVIKFIHSNIKKGKPLFDKIKMRKDETSILYPNINKVKKVFNWVPKTSIDKGLIKTISFYTKNNKNFIKK